MVDPDPGGVQPGAPEATLGEVATHVPADAGVDEAPCAPPYLVSLALQRGPYPYEHRTVVVAALDAVTASESHPDDWVKAIRRAHKEGGEVRVVRIAIDIGLVAGIFEEGSRPRPAFERTVGGGRYMVRLALCHELPPVVVAAVDEEMARDMGIDLAGPLRVMPVFYRRQVSRAYGELREILVSLPRGEVDAAFDPPPVDAEVLSVLSADDPRF
ncbi:MAG: hypothetical protein ACLP62_15110 [Acidimicrobiales bacterium]